MSQVLFLDFDGVLNSDEYNLLNENIDDWNYSYDVVLDEKAIKLLNIICKFLPDMKIVISSSWRTHYDMNIMLQKLFDVGFRYLDVVIGYTPVTHQTRGADIYEYCLNNIVETFCILDDSADIFSHQKDSFIQTNPAIGLTIIEVFKVIQHFDSENEFVKKYKYILED